MGYVGAHSENVGDHFGAFLTEELVEFPYQPGVTPRRNVIFWVVIEGWSGAAKHIIGLAGNPNERGAFRQFL